MGRRKQNGAHLTKIERLVLQALVQIGENAYGIAIRQQIAAMGEVVSLAAVYFALERMENAGYVRTKMGTPDPERGGKAKRYFFITGSGADALRESTVSAEQAMRALTGGAIVGGAA